MHSAVSAPIRGGTREASALHAALLILLTVATFARVCTHEFLIWDDKRAIWQSPLLNPPSWENLKRLWQQPQMSLYIPVTYTLWSATAAVAWVDQPDERGAHLNPYAFHGLNLLLHLLTALVVWQILLYLVPRGWAALAGAMLFAVHPVQVEPVAWAAGTKDLLCGLLSLLAAWEFVKFLDEPAPRRRAGRFALATALFLAALLAKPAAVVVPLLALGLALWKPRPWSRADRVALASWFALALVGAIVTKLIQPAGRGVVIPAPLWARPFIALDALAFYLGKLVWPMNLAVDYARSPAALLAGRAWYVTSILPLLVVAILFALRVGRRVWLAAACFVAALLPVLGLATFHFQYYSTVADHYLYLPMFGVALAVAWGLNRVRPSPVVGIICAAIILLLAARSFVQAGNWRDDLTLFRHTARVSPRSSAAHHNLGWLLVRQGHLDEALAEYRLALQLRPADVVARKETGMILMQKGQVDDGLAEYAEALHYARHQQPELDRSDLYIEGASLAMRFGRPQRARQFLEEARRLYPHNDAVKTLLDELDR